MRTGGVYVGLGANLGDARAQVLAAFAALEQLPDTQLLRKSSLYRSAPLGRTDQPDFVNAVAEISTGLDPDRLLAALHDIESEHGRTRPYVNAPRTLDLDLLLYGTLIRDSGTLHVPHPRLHQRAFVLGPLLEIRPELSIPGRGRADELLQACAGQRIERLH